VRGFYCYNDFVILMDYTDPLTLNHIVEGEIGHPTLLVHDIGASMHDWEALIPLLVTTGHRVYACDLPGHGRSPHLEDPRQYYAQMHVTAFRRWVDCLDLLRAPILIGHGFGAYLCLRYALGHPYKIFRLILLNPLLMPEQLSPIVTYLHRYPVLARLAWRYAPDWTRRQVLGIQKEATPPAVEQRVLKDFQRAAPLNVQIPFTIADLTPDLHNLVARSLFIVGENDPLLDMTMLPTLFEDMVEITSITLPGVGHRPHLEMPEETNRLIINFLLGF
jgi:pimeloyl-ACP methyl ester carboxylesterase